MTDKKNYSDTPLENAEDKKKNYSDAPLENPDDDKLNFAPYAQTLAKAIANVRLDNGLVMAIYGEWGSGKSTLINFILKYLKPSKNRTKKSNVIIKIFIWIITRLSKIVFYLRDIVLDIVYYFGWTKKQELIFVKFNPWLFSGKENLTSHFFDEIQSALRNKFVRLSLKIRKYGKKINNVATYFQIPILSTLIANIPILSIILIPIVIFLKIFSTLFENNDSISANQIKDQITKLLTKSRYRILVVVDDIDRLDSEEIDQLFGLIKSVANFPNVIYLLAFDRDVVGKAISSKYGDGDAFLEKIVQFPFEMPALSQKSLDNLFISKIEDILEEPIPETFYAFNGDSGYYTYLSSLITTPRDIIRFINTFEVTYSGVRDYVDESDFIAIEMLRMFRPFIYYLIKGNKNELTKLRYNSALRQDLLNSENVAIKLRFGEFLNNFIPIITSDEYRVNYRLCSLEYFDTYFSYSSSSIYKKADVLIKSLSQGLDELISLFENTIRQDVSEFEELLIYITQSQGILSRYYNLILKSLFEVSDLALKPENTKNNIRYWIIRVIESIISLHAPNENEMYNMVQNLISNREPTYIAVLLVNIFFKVGTSVTVLHQKEKLKPHIMPHIHGLSELNIELDDIKFGDVIDLWIEIEPNEARDWLINRLKNHHHLLQFIEPYIKPNNNILSILYRYFGNKEELNKIFQDISQEADLSTDEILLWEKLKNQIR